MTKEKIARINELAHKISLYYSVIIFPGSTSFY